MADFERQLMGDIPLHEAANFFTSMKQPLSTEGAQEKLAGAASDMMDQLARGEMPGGKAGKFKPVDEIKDSEKTAATLREVEDKTTKKMKSLYRDAGVTRGGTKGGIMGAAAGAATGALKGGKRGALKGLALGGTSGAGLGGLVGGVKGTHKGRYVGEHINSMRRGSIIKSLKLQAMGNRLKQAAAKLAFGEEVQEGGGPNMEGGQPAPAQQGAPGEPTPPVSTGMAPTQDPEAAKPSTAPTIPVNYMASELMAHAAQEANEVGFLRERLNAATEQNNAMQQQVQEAQAQLEQLQADSAATGDQIMSATNEAVAASDRALQQSLQAASMRIGIQKMRESMLQLASQDPESVGAIAQQEQVQAEQQMAGAPEQAASPAAVGDESAVSGPESGAPAEPPTGGGSKPSINIKTGGAAPGALPGAVAGLGLAALQGYRQSQGVEGAQQNVDQLEREQTGSFGKALDLAKAKKILVENELAQAHPVASNIKNLVGGALGGAAVGTAVKRLYDTTQRVL